MFNPRLLPADPTSLSAYPLLDVYTDRDKRMGGMYWHEHLQSKWLTFVGVSADNYRFCVFRGFLESPDCSYVLKFGSMELEVACRNRENIFEGHIFRKPCNLIDHICPEIT